MFGYIKPYKSEMKVREHEIFKSYYCGVCKTIGRNHNQLSRMGLNFDFTFLAILLSSMESNKSSIVRVGCMIKGFKKKNIIESNRSLDYTSSISIILLYYKLIDDWRDERSVKSLLVSIPFAIATRKIKRDYDSQFKAVEGGLSLLSQLEKEECDLVDKVADVFGTLMAEIVVPDFIESEGDRRIISTLGYHMGRWIYILDALDDLESDLKSKSYNPIIHQYRYSRAEGVGLFRERVLKDIEFSLTMSLDMVAKSFELLDIKQNKGILENIIYMGMRSEMEKILLKGEV